MKIVFIGYAVDEIDGAQLSGISVAGNKMQLNVIRELNASADVDIHIITILPVATFPHDKRIVYRSSSFTIRPNTFAKAVSFINIPILKQISQICSVYREAAKIVDADTVILAFNMFPQVGIPALKLRKKFGCQVCSLLADLPIDDNVSKTRIFRNYLRKKFEALTIKAIRQCDKLIVLNKSAAEKYAPGVPYFVMEGGVNPEEYINVTEQPSIKEKNVVYTGALVDYSGILTLIEAVKMLADIDIKLDIYGNGPLRNVVEQYAQMIPNVRYYGTRINKDILKKQRVAWLLINPRPVENSIAKVTFPSKIFEYMMSGRPVLSTRLNGFRDEYSDNLFWADDDSAAGLARAIREIDSMSEESLAATARGARNFLIQNKSWKANAERMLFFLHHNTQGND